jgi:hypothetical protein
VEVVSLALKLSRRVDLVCHDACDGLFHILHPLHHLGLPHKVDILDEGIVLLPERHCGAGVLTAALLIYKRSNVIQDELFNSVAKYIETS